MARAKRPVTGRVATAGEQSNRMTGRVVSDRGMIRASDRGTSHGAGNPMTIRASATVGRHGLGNPGIRARGLRPDVAYLFAFSRKLNVGINSNSSLNPWTPNNELNAIE